MAAGSPVWGPPDRSALNLTLAETRRPVSWSAGSAARLRLLRGTGAPALLHSGRLSEGCTARLRAASLRLPCGCCLYNGIGLSDEAKEATWNSCCS